MRRAPASGFPAAHGKAIGICAASWYRVPGRLPKDCLLTALFYRVAQRRGLKKAALAVAHRILIIAYHVIRDGTCHRE